MASRHGEEDAYLALDRRLHNHGYELTCFELRSWCSGIASMPTSLTPARSRGELTAWWQKRPLTSADRAAGERHRRLT